MNTEVFEGVALVGSFFRGKDSARLVELYEPGQTGLTLVREPDNNFDPNAIKVIDSEIWVGYVARSMAEWIAPKLDEGWEVDSIVVTEIGRNAKNKPEPIMKITLRLFESEDERFDETVSLEELGMLHD